MKPHKHAELIKAWADGAEIEFRYVLSNHREIVWSEWFNANLTPAWSEDYEFRIKPESQTAEQQSGYSRLEWAEDLIKQLPETHDGRNSWLLNYGSKPEPKPDVIRYLKKSAIHGWFETNNYLEGNCTNAIIKLTFDGETGELKSAEVLK